LLGFSIFLRVKLLFVRKFALNELVNNLKLSCFGHNTLHDSGVCHPLLFSLLLVIRPEESIGSENWQCDVGGCAPWDACADQVMRKAVDDTGAGALEATVDQVDPWLDGEETHEGTSLELDEVLTIGRATLDVDDQWLHISVGLAKLLSINNLLLDELLVAAARPI
jgi:hypothetical protein